MDDFIIAIYRFVLRLFVIAAVVIAALWIGAMGIHGGILPGQVVLVAIGFVVGAIMIVGHFITVLALRDATDRQTQLLERLVATVEPPRAP